MFGLLARLLEVLYSFWPFYGGSIVLFTLVIMLALTPLTFKSTRSMLAMQALQPEMKKLQNRYKDDRQKLNEEMMKFYKENKISPLGGCLPMLVQLPVFFIVYELLERLTRRGPYGGDLGTSVACNLANGQHCVDHVFTQGGYFHPEYLNTTSRLYIDLTHTRTMDSWGIDLSQSAMKALSEGIVHALPYLIMVLVVVGLTYIQQVQLQSRTPKGAEVNATQQMTMKIMPVVMGVIYIIIPACVVVYFLASSLFRIGQQAMVTRTFYSGPNAIAIPTTAVEEKADKPKSFLEKFKPSEEAMPRVGSRAKQDGGASKNGAASKRSGSSKPGSKSQGKQASPANGKRTSQKGTQKPGQKGGASPKSGAKKSGGTKKARPEPSKASASSGDEAVTSEAGTEPDVVAPSRKAPSSRPSRSAPTRPNPRKKD